MADLSAPTTLRDRLARAICAESCAFRGEPPCWKAEGEPWPNPNCDEPGCHALADAARAAIRKATEPAPCPFSPKTIEAVGATIAYSYAAPNHTWLTTATAAITAFLAAMKKEGYVMVPVDPTEKMVLSAAAKLGSMRSAYAKTWRAYRAMLAARPDGEG